MQRWARSVWVWAAAAAGVAYGASLLGDSLGWDALVAPGVTFAVVAAFGWARRGREIIDVFPSAALVGYAAFIGLAAARASDTNAFAVAYNGTGPWHLFGSVQITSWPLILVAGVAYAFAAAIFAALPASALVRPPEIDREADAKFWSFVRDHTQPDERKA